VAKDIRNAPALDYSSKLQPGVRGEIVINAGIYKGRYPSRVEDVRGEMVGFAHPLMKGALLPAYREMNFNFILEDSSALYVFEMAVRRVDTQTGLPILWAISQGYPRRVQRRQFLRVSCLWDISVFHLDNELRTPMTSRWLEARAIDISLGGYRFRIADEEAAGVSFETGDRLFVRFSLADREHFQLGRASRILHPDDMWEVGVGFDSLATSVEKRLFEYIRQQEIMARERE
jgi:Predicted glycosyltransferase